MSLRKKLFPLFLIISLSSCSQKYTHSVYLENDALSSVKSDANYTNGIQYMIEPHMPILFTDEGKVIKETPNEEMLFLPAVELLRKISVGTKKSEPDIVDAEDRVLYRFGQTIYTPDDLKPSGVQLDDRPYGGLLFASMDLNNISENKIDGTATKRTTSLTVGIVGEESGAEAVQTWYHDDVCDCTHPAGWDNQLDFEPGFILGWEFQQRLLRTGNDFNSINSDFIWNARGDIGNIYTGAELGVQYRFGYQIPKAWNMGTIAPAIIGFSKVTGYSLYLFGYVKQKFVARDIFLDGNTFKDSIHTVDKESIFSEQALGLQFRKEKFGLRIYNAKRTEQFKLQQNPHRFGAVVITWKMDF